jgi:hypothetical protein
MLQAGRLENELNAIITDKNAEVEKIAIVLENETGLLNDDTLTSERLEEILRAMKHQAEHASELIKEQAAEVERLTAALEFYANPNNWEPRVATESDAVLDGGEIASAAREKREAANE